MSYHTAILLRATIESQNIEDVPTGKLNLEEMHVLSKSDTMVNQIR